MVLVMWGEQGVSNDAETEPLFGQSVRWEVKTQGQTSKNSIELSYSYVLVSGAQPHVKLSFNEVPFKM